ncbi:hypothetical protein AcW1_001923 [Taiwanofungus camphoratus]|nr:hypothetical protein AcV5_000026 [Antrodia cinnamomea]KAI0945158.1 hypothetical protein AcV7_001772 [Antrodia cinnamomea]KAI0945781.1 hypothetical protein AcW1_001923 [Antrodia cinnamomea]
MVTGDFKLTALAIAKQVGIVTQEKVETASEIRSSNTESRFLHVSPSEIKPAEDGPICALVLTGDDIETLEPEDWNMIVGNYTEIVFARTTPEQKL